MFGGDGGGGENETLSPIVKSSSMPSSPLRPPYAAAAEMLTSSAAGSRNLQQNQQQQPQWGQQETRELIMIRGQLEENFNAAKRNKMLWEVVSLKMNERGYGRTPDQCKCKWKNLLNRYKGTETSDPDVSQLCPFFEEIHAVFTERVKDPQQFLLESETGTAQAKKRVKRTGGDQYSNVFLEGEDYDTEEDNKPARSKLRKRKSEKVTSTGSIQDMLKEFFERQQAMEAQWMEMMERRARERQLFEQEWRQSMEQFERERLMIEKAWREREEQRRIREESRAERRDALLTTLLGKLIND